MTDSTPTEPREEVLSTIAGDRACVTCGFNLHGQQVVREPHYGLVAARCPECGTLAALQEYPALGKWSRRWATTLAGLWLFVMIGVFAGTTMMTFGLTIGSVESASDIAETQLASQYSDWVRGLDQAQQDAIGQSIYFAGNANFTYSPWDVPDPSWPMIDDPARALDDIGGPWAAMDRTVRWLWILLAVLACPFGIFWSLALLHQKPWIAGLVPLAAVAAAGSLFISFGMSESAPPYTFDEMARSIYTPIAAPISLALMGGMMVVWGLVARPLARVVVRLALPPRLRVPFGILWSHAGKPMPRPR